MRAYLLIEQHDTAAREELGSWYLASGNFTKAAGTLEELIRTLEQQDPPDLPRLQAVRRKVVEAYMVRNRFSDAAFHLEILRQQLRAAGQDDADVLVNLAKCKIKLGREDEAVKDFSDAITLKPERVEIYYYKASALLNTRLQDQPKAEKCMAEMIAYWETGPGSKDKDKAADAHHKYGLWLDGLGKHLEALKQAEATLALKKDHTGGLYLAGKSELALAAPAEMVNMPPPKAGQHVPTAEDHLHKAEDYARGDSKRTPRIFPCIRSWPTSRSNESPRQGRSKS